MRLRQLTLLLCLHTLILLPASALAQDSDGDTFSVAQGDCDDTSALNAPNSTEMCDGVDNDCDGLSDEVGASPSLCGTNAAIEMHQEAGINN